MAIVDEDMKDDSMYSLPTSLSPNLDFENLSLDDVAWADSCLNKDKYSVDTDWTSIKDALFHILNQVDGDFGEAESIDISDHDHDLLFRNKGDWGRGKILVDNVFRPNYSEDVNLENLDLDLSSNDVGPSSEDIFKVWDLGIIDEQDELTQELNKAIVDIPLQIQSDTDDSVTLKDLMQVSIDDIISGMNDLSLKQYA